MRFESILLFVAFISGCSTQPSKMRSIQPQSAAYNQAVDQALADLQNHDENRSPASTNLAATATQNFSKTRYFEVIAYPKVASFSKRGRDPKLNQKLGKPVTFQYRVDRQGHCALGREVVPESELTNCVQVELKPAATTEKSGQFVRIFMNPDYRVYGLSYHDLNSARN